MCRANICTLEKGHQTCLNPTCLFSSTTFVVSLYLPLWSLSFLPANPAADGSVWSSCKVLMCSCCQARQWWCYPAWTARGWSLLLPSDGDWWLHSGDGENGVRTGAVFIHISRTNRPWYTSNCKNTIKFSGKNKNQLKPLLRLLTFFWPRAMNLSMSSALCTT